MPLMFQRDRDGLTSASLVHAAGDPQQFVEGTTIPDQNDLRRGLPLHLLPHGAIRVTHPGDDGWPGAQRRALVSRLRDADGALWQQTEWQAGGQIILVRYRGTLDELLKIAGSVRE